MGIKPRVWTLDIAEVHQRSPTQKPASDAQDWRGASAQGLSLDPRHTLLACAGSFTRPLETGVNQHSLSVPQAGNLSGVNGPAVGSWLQRGSWVWEGGLAQALHCAADLGMLTWPP